MVGGGLTLVHCNHTGNVSVAQLAAADDMVRDGMAEGGGNAACCGMEPDCCCHQGMMKASVGEVPCMRYSFWVTQPTNSANGFHIDVNPLYCIVHDFIGSAIALPRKPIVRSALPEGNGRHGPPRSYLRLIRILQI